MIFFVDVAVKYLIFKISSIQFIVHIAIDRHSIFNKEQVGVCLTKITQILSILHGFKLH